jgi:hypothetical protein
MMTDILSNATYLKRVKYVMSTIGFQSRNMNLISNDLGETPLVIALPHEPMQDVVTRLHDAGGTANIVVAFPRKVVVFPLTAQMPEGEIVEMPISNTMSIGMFLQQSKKKKHHSQSLRLTFSDRDFSAEYQTNQLVFEYS